MPGPSTLAKTMPNKYLLGDLEDPANIEALKASGLRLETEEKRRKAEDKWREAEEEKHALRLARINMRKTRWSGSASGDLTSSSTTRKEGPSGSSCSRPDELGQDGTSSASSSSITQPLDVPSSSSGMNSTKRRSSCLGQRGLVASPADRTEHLNQKQGCTRPKDVIVIDHTNDEEIVGPSEYIMKGNGVKPQEAATERSETKIRAGTDEDFVMDNNDMKVKVEPHATEDVKMEDIKVKDEAEPAQSKVSSSKPVVVRTEVIVIEDDSDKDVGPSVSHPGRVSMVEGRGSDSRRRIPSADLCVAEEYAGIAAAIGIKTDSDVQALVQPDEGEHRFIEADLHRKGFSTFDYMKFMHSLRAECAKDQSSGKKEEINGDF